MYKMYDKKKFKLLDAGQQEHRFYPNTKVKQSRYTPWRLLGGEEI
jgi:hypothetical protein